MNTLPTAFEEVKATCVSGPSAAEADNVITVPTVAEPEAQPAPRTAPGDPEHDWLCAWCHNPVANEKDRFNYSGKDEFTFRNPEGIRFTIMTFSRTLGCRESGAPTLKHTWFPGYAWSYCQCDNCGQHLGWYYAGHVQFAGLITARVVRAVCISN